VDDATVRHAHWALGLVFFVNGAIFASWAVRIPAVANGLELTPGALGFALLCQAVGTPIVMPVCGAMVTRFGSRPVTRAVLLAACVALPLPALAPNVWGLAAALALLGGSVGALVVAQNAQGVAIEKIGGRPILNGLHGLLSLGWLAGSLAGAGAARAGLSPLTHFAAVSASLLVVGLLATTYLLAARTDRDSVGSTFARPSAKLAVLGAISFCCLLAEGSVLDWSAVYLRNSLGASESLAALGPAAFAAAVTAGRFSGNRLVERLSPLGLVRGAAILATLGILVAVAVGQPWVGVAGFGLLGAGLSVIFPILLSTAGADRAASPGPQVAAVATAGYLGLLAGPGLIGVVAELSDLRSALVVVVLLVGTIPAIAGWSSLAKVPAKPKRAPPGQQHDEK
jgi:fucose permease